MGQKEPCQLPRDNSDGTYRPSAQAADEIERLQKAWDSAYRQANENGSEAAKLRACLSRCIQRLKEYADADALSRGEGGGVWSDPDEFIRGVVDEAEALLSPTAAAQGPKRSDGPATAGSDLQRPGSRQPNGGAE